MIIYDENLLVYANKDYSALVDFPNGGSRVYKLEELMNKLIADGL